MSKLRLFLLFGGKSTEHDVSLLSAKAIYHALDTNVYDVVPVGISKTGSWIGPKASLEHLQTSEPMSESGVSQHILDCFPISYTKNHGSSPKNPPFIIFPVFHGRYGEDGIIQGICEYIDAPYVGSGVLGSAVGMDKVRQKYIATTLGIPVTPFLSFAVREWQEKRQKVEALITQTFHRAYPLFVKPANTGSSVGVVKVHTQKELASAVHTASQYDRTIIIEQGLEHIREIEVSCLGNTDVSVSVPGEVISAHEFYDYEAKYANNKTQIIIPADLSKKTIRTVQEMAKTLYTGLDCAGLARVDFFLIQDGTVLFNEVNTMPGFTAMSMYPKLWEASGLPFGKLLDRLITLGIERWQERMAIVTSR